MTLDQLYRFASGDPKGPSRQLGLTIEAARNLCREIEAMQAKDCPAQYEPAERDDGKHASRFFARFQGAEAADEMLFENHGIASPDYLRRRGVM